MPPHIWPPIAPRQTDPESRPPRSAQYLRSVAALDRFAREHYGKGMLALALRWVLDQPGVDVALWGARSPGQLGPLDAAMGWTLDEEAMLAIDAIVREHVTDPIGPDFMAPPARQTSRPTEALSSTA